MEVAQLYNCLVVVDFTEKILKQVNLKKTHMQCKILKISGQSFGLLIEKYIHNSKLNSKYNSSSDCIGDLNIDGINYEIKASNGGKEHNKFNYVQIRPHHLCNYILTAYFLSVENVDQLGELFIFKLTSTEMKNMILKHGHYAHGTKLKNGKIDFNNGKEYALRIKYGSKSWNDLLAFRIDSI
jgi:hypothetical protein